MSGLLGLASSHIRSLGIRRIQRSSVPSQSNRRWALNNCASSTNGRRADSSGPLRRKLEVAVAENANVAVHDLIRGGQLIAVGMMLDHKVNVCEIESLERGGGAHLIDGHVHRSFDADAHRVTVVHQLQHSKELVTWCDVLLSAVPVDASVPTILPHTESAQKRARKCQCLFTCSLKTQ